jgi:hypothetical protein
MSRKNNKSIKKRYNDYLKSREKAENQKKEERELKKEVERQEEEAEELLEGMGLDEDEDRPEKMDIEKRKKGRQIKKSKALRNKKHDKKRRMK